MASIRDKISVLICDDHTIWRHGVASILSMQPDIDAIEACDGYDAVNKAEDHKPHVCFLDLYMPRLDGLKSIRKIRKVSPRTRIIMLTVSERSDHIVDAMEKGIYGYLSKGASPNEIISAVYDVNEGKRVFSNNATAKLLSSTKGVGINRLSSREEQVMYLMSEGYSNHQIANLLGISSNTVRTHLYRIKKKLQLDSRASIIAYSVKIRSNR